MFSLGTVSHGTLKTDDLLEAFAWELESRTRNSDKSTKAVRELITDAHMYATLMRADHLNDDGHECASELVDELSERLNELAPDYVHFGAHDGDGSDFGFWPCIESLEEAVRDGEVLKVEDLGQVPGLYDGLVMQVSDHGNVTLYSIQGASSPVAGARTVTELWSVV